MLLESVEQRGSKYYKTFALPSQSNAKLASSGNSLPASRTRAKIVHLHFQ